MNTAQILAAISAETDPVKQRALVAQLREARLRQAQAAQAQASRSAGTQRVASRMTPVHAHSHHTAETDWLGKVASDHDAERVHRQATAAATEWFRGVNDIVRSDRGELTVQAQWYARRWGSQFGMESDVAVGSFLQRVSHLAGFKVASDDEEEPEENNSTDSAMDEGDDDPKNTTDKGFEDDEDASGDPEETKRESSRKRASQQDVFDADLRKFNEALAPYVITLPDGATVLDPSAPASITGPYQRLLQYGYANGLIASRKTAAEGRPLYEIAQEISRDWQNVYFGAQPYLDAMFDLNSISDMYYQDSAKSIVAYFLSNASSWKGETAKRIKSELKAMLSRKASRWGEAPEGSRTAGYKVIEDPEAAQFEPYLLYSVVDDEGTLYGRWPTREAAEEHLQEVTYMGQFTDGTPKSQWRPRGASRTAGISLTNVGFEGRIGGDTAHGYDASGNKVIFRLSPQDAKDLAFVMTSDLGMNFSGIEVDEADIISTGSRRTAARKQTKFNICPAHQSWFSGLSRYRTAEVFCEGGPGSAPPCSGEGCSFSPGTDLFEPSICDSTFDTKPGSKFAWAVNSAVTASRRTADQGFGPDKDNQSGAAESALPNVDVSADETFEMGWTQDDPEGADEMAPEGEIGPFDAARRTAAGPMHDYRYDTGIYPAQAPRNTSPMCACAHNSDGTVTTMLCPLHADDDPCATMAAVTGKRRQGSIVNGTCTNCGWSDRRTAALHTADQGFGPDADSQSGHAESDLEDVDVQDDEDTNLGWVEDDSSGYDDFNEGRYGSLRVAADQFAVGDQIEWTNWNGAVGTGVVTELDPNGQVWISADATPGYPDTSDLPYPVWPSRVQLRRRHGSRKTASRKHAAEKVSISLAPNPRGFSPFEVGDRVEVQFYSGAWEAATVVSIDGDVIEYQLDDGYTSQTRSTGDPVGIRLATVASHKQAGTITSKDPDLDAAPKAEQDAYWSWVSQMAADSDAAYFVPLRFKSWRSQYWDDAANDVQSRYRDTRGGFNWPMMSSRKHADAPFAGSEDGSKPAGAAPQVDDVVDEAMFEADEVKDFTGPEGAAANLSAAPPFTARRKPTINDDELGIW